MTTIVFVDDEPLVLEGLQNLLRRRRAEWQMHFLSNAGEALQLLDERAVDILITDLRMPGIDGADLIREVQQRHPGVVRMVLSGQADRDITARTAPISHRILSKPCDAETLQNAIHRALQLLAVLRSNEILEAVGSIGQLPSAPQTYAALKQELASSDCSIARASALIAQDTALSAKLLQIANSAFFGSSRAVNSVEQAAVYLGLNTLRNLVLIAESAQLGKNAPFCPGFSLASLQKHALLTAAIAAKLVPDAARGDELITVALLHDIGHILMSVRLPDFLQDAVRLAQTRRCPIHEAEQELRGTTHAALGGYLLNLWGVPPSVVEPISFHHSPEILGTREFGVGTILYIADILADEALVEEESIHCPADLSQFLAIFGLQDKLPVWRSMALQEAEAIAATSWI